MKATGPKHERETIILFNEESDTCSIWTASDAIYRRLRKRLGTTYLTEDHERHAVFTFPKKWAVLPRIHIKKAPNPNRTANFKRSIARPPILS